MVGLVLLLQDLPMNDKVRECVEEVSVDRARETSTRLAEFRTRNLFSSRAEEHRAWILERLGGERHEFEARDRSDPTRAATGVNLFLFLQGNERPDEVVVLGGHYDSWNARDLDPDAVAPGANDDGSGTTAVLEAARVLSSRSWRRSIVLVAFDGEEHGLLGSRAFVPYLEERGLRVVGMVNNDIVGGPRERQVRLYSEEGRSRAMARYAEVVAERYVDIDLVPQDRGDRPGRGGDHLPFSRAGHPAIRFIDLTETLEHQHSETDTADRLDFEQLAMVTRADIAVVASLADGPDAPAVRSEGARYDWDAVAGAQGYLVGQVADGVGLVRVERTDATSATYELNPPGRIVVAVIGEDGLLGPFSDQLD